MTSKNATIFSFDHLHLADWDRRLIAKACEGGTTVFLAPLDKGLSGSSIWQAKWRLTGGVETKLHVFKIGKKQKIKREEEAIRQIASVLDKGFRQANLYVDDISGYALLRQEFVGDPKGEIQSLRKFIEKCRDSRSAREVILSLYLDRMKAWHPRAHSYQIKKLRYRDALDWWVKRVDFAGAFGQIGEEGLERSLLETFGITQKQLIQGTSSVWNSMAKIPIGPVHGDLHSQNVVLDRTKKIDLIDFAWTNQKKWKAIDFLMMECSLKFVASPPSARLVDLLLMEKLVDSHSFGSSDADFEQLSNSTMHGAELAVVARCLLAVRHCALSLGAVESVQQYRAGLVTLMAGLTSLPTLLNRVFLIHSIAYHLSRLIGENDAS